MSKKLFLSCKSYVLHSIFPLSFLFALIGCAGSGPAIRMVQPFPSIVKQYKSIELDRHNTEDFIDTGVRVVDGDFITLMAGGYMFRGQGIYSESRGPELRVAFKIGIDGKVIFNGSGVWKKWVRGKVDVIDNYKIDGNGNIFLRLAKDVDDFQGSFAIDIIVWNKEDPIQIVAFLEELGLKDSNNEDLQHLTQEFKARKQIFLAEQKAQKEVEEAQNAIIALKEEKTPEGKEVQKAEQVSEKRVQIPQKESKQPIENVEQKKTIEKDEGKKAQKEVEEVQSPIIALKEEKAPEVNQKKERVSEENVQIPKKETIKKEEEKEKQLAELHERLNTALQALKEVEGLKKRLQEESDQREKLAFQLKSVQEKQKQLIKKPPPLIVITSPKDGITADTQCIRLSGVVEDNQAISKLEIRLNDQTVRQEDYRKALPPIGRREIKRVELSEKICLQEGNNRIAVITQDPDGQTSKRELKIQWAKKREEIWSVVIGVNKYKHVPPLKYAVEDAREFYRYLIDTNRIPKDRVTLLLDEEVTLGRLRSVLGTLLRKRAGKDDMVIIFFAGHGATEIDNSSPDGDGLEKYILPVDADPKDLYATALPMNEISKIFQRIASEKIILISDTCYSGASGGRTIAALGSRANVSSSFLERVSQGKGRVILTASDANEVSIEKDELKHGVFTYYLLEALSGKGDLDGDGLITVDEVFRYVSINVPKATGQNQHPIRKGEAKGQMVIGITK